MRAAIVTVGDELIGGEKEDSNFRTLARRLSTLGVEVALHSTVKDDEVAIARALKSTQDVAGIVIVTGGLGPTSDDVTREGIARALGRELTFNDAVAARLSARFPEADEEHIALILKQAYAVEEAEIIMPRRGTAPGLILFDGDQTIYVLPGVPAELDEMLQEKVLPDIVERAGPLAALVRRTLRSAGLPEATVQTSISDLEPVYGAVRFGLLAHPALVDIVLVGPEPVSGDIEEVVDEIKSRLGEAVYGEGTRTLAAAVGRALAQRGKTVATAESCTGGLLAELITDEPGSSDYFVGGVVAYADAAKRDLLGVDDTTLDREGAVSRQTAERMARGVRKSMRSDFGIGITGVAGPGGGTERTPVGTVHVCVVGDSAQRHLLLEQAGSRRQVRERAANSALNELRLLLLQY